VLQGAFDENYPELKIDITLRAPNPAAPQFTWVRGFRCTADHRRFFRTGDDIAVTYGGKVAYGRVGKCVDITVGPRIFSFFFLFWYDVIEPHRGLLPAQPGPVPRVPKPKTKPQTNAKTSSKDSQKLPVEDEEKEEKAAAPGSAEPATAGSASPSPLPPPPPPPSSPPPPLPSNHPPPQPQPQASSSSASSSSSPPSSLQVQLAMARLAWAKPTVVKKWDDDDYTTVPLTPARFLEPVMVLHRCVRYCNRTPPCKDPLSCACNRKCRTKLYCKHHRSEACRNPGCKAKGDIVCIDKHNDEIVEYVVMDSKFGFKAHP